MAKLSERDLIRLATCDVKLQMVGEKVAVQTDIMIVCGFRDETAQNMAYDNGKSGLRWPDSKHNHEPSLAFDIVPFQHGQAIDWEAIDQWRLMASYVWEVSLKFHVPLSWGGYFQDYSHFEIVK